MNTHLVIKFMRYFGGSLIALGADVGMMWGLVNYANVSYLYAAAIGFSFGGIVKYLVSKYLVFEDNRGSKKALSIALFIFFSMCGLFVNHLILYVGVDLIGLHLLLAKVFSAGFVFFMNFFLMGFFVFKDPLVRKTI